jgi:inward rectifier potassium channel
MAGLGSTRVFAHHAGGGTTPIGLRRPMRDLYHDLVTGSWARLFLVFAAVYFLTGVLFVALRMLLEWKLRLDPAALAGGLVAAGAPPAAPAPTSLRSLALAAAAGVEGFVHWVELVIASGIVLAKFSHLRARVLFSRVAVVAPHAGGTALMFRMANERTSHIVDAKVQMMLVRNEVSDGDFVRRAHDLELQRGGSALFALAWTAIHPIDRDGPLFGETAASLERAEAEIIVTLTGFDEALTRVMYARHVYPADRIRWDQRFREIVRKLPDGTRVVDYGLFHETEPADDTRPERAPSRRAR